MRSDELALAAVLSAPLFMTARVAIVLRCRYKYGDAVACMRPRCSCTGRGTIREGRAGRLSRAETDEEGRAHRVAPLHTTRSYQEQALLASLPPPHFR